jgi:SAM-dependent methyltransferase
MFLARPIHAAKRLAHFVLRRVGLRESGEPFRESKLAHQYLDGLDGIEIGPSAHNPYNIPGCRYVDLTDSMDSTFRKYEAETCGHTQPIDVVAPAWQLPFADDSLGYVLTSHVIEHCFDPIAAVKEWLRVIRPGGYIFAIIPHKERTPDKPRPRTTLQELLDRHSGVIPPPAAYDYVHHYCVWITRDWVDLCRHFGWKLVDHRDRDDKVGNGFTIVIQK